MFVRRVVNMFSAATRLVTRGVIDKVPVDVQLWLWSLVDSMHTQVESVDYLQVFELTANGDGGQKIIHFQEIPPYRAEYLVDHVLEPLVVKVYVIDDGDYSTMLLPTER